MLNSSEKQFRVPSFSSFQVVFRQDLNGSLEKQFPTAGAPEHDRRNKPIPEQILGRQRFPEAEWLNRRVNCQRFSS
jgi:hypothetical protein